MNKSMEQQARDLLEQCGVEDAQSFSAGDVVALANVLSDLVDLRRCRQEMHAAMRAWAKGLVTDAEAHWRIREVLQDQIRDARA